MIVLLIGTGIFLYFRNMNSSLEKSNYETNHIEETNTSTENQANSSATNGVKKGIAEAENTPPPTPKEEQIATYTTKIYSKDSARQNNISITCKTLNGTIVKNGATFSFCNTLGPSSTSKGYQEADIFDKDGNKKKGLGGRKLSD